MMSEDTKICRFPIKKCAHDFRTLTPRSPRDVGARPSSRKELLPWMNFRGVCYHDERTRFVSHIGSMRGGQALINAGFARWDYVSRKRRPTAMRQTPSDGVVGRKWRGICRLWNGRRANLAALIIQVIYSFWRGRGDYVEHHVTVKVLCIGGAQ